MLVKNLLSWHHSSWIWGILCEWQLKICLHRGQLRSWRLPGLEYGCSDDFVQTNYLTKFSWSLLHQSCMSQPRFLWIYCYLQTIFNRAFLGFPLDFHYGLHWDSGDHRELNSIIVLYNVQQRTVSWTNKRNVWKGRGREGETSNAPKNNEWQTLIAYHTKNNHPSKTHLWTRSICINAHEWQTARTSTDPVKISWFVVISVTHKY